MAGPELIIVQRGALLNTEVDCVHADQSPSAKTAITPEQKERMECNKRAALERRKFFLESKHFEHAQGQSKRHLPYSMDIDSQQSSSQPLPSTSSNRRKRLSEQQIQVLQAVLEGKSLFITGSAGTGKSFLLMHVVRALKKLHGPENVYVTASTGVAACALNGQTIHSFSGVGLGTGTKESLFLRAARNRQTTKRWRTAEALVIDEVSMISGELFDILEYIAWKMRIGAAMTDRVWGGLQLVVSGDFFQLPPIDVANPKKEFAFEADCWNQTFDMQVELTHVFRQSDSKLVALLQNIRTGQIDHTHLQLLANSSRIPTFTSETADIVTRLYPRNDDVRRLNDGRLQNLGGKIVTYTAIDTGREPWLSQLKQGIALGELKLSLGARVMLIKNTDPGVGLVNGATGFVIGFEEHDMPESRVNLSSLNPSKLLPKVRFDVGLEVVVEPEKWDIMEGEAVLATRMQVPLILAWALSIHKCQGMTLDHLHTDLSRAFGCGMVYVALSRVRSLEGLSLSGFDTSKIKAHPKVIDFYRTLQSG